MRVGVLAGAPGWCPGEQAPRGSDNCNERCQRRACSFIKCTFISLAHRLQRVYCKVQRSVTGGEVIGGPVLAPALKEGPFRAQGPAAPRLGCVFAGARVLTRFHTCWAYGVPLIPLAVPGGFGAVQVVARATAQLAVRPGWLGQAGGSDVARGSGSCLSRARGSFSTGGRRDRRWVWKVMGTKLLVITGGVSA